MAAADRRPRPPPAAPRPFPAGAPSGGALRTARAALALGGLVAWLLTVASAALLVVYTAWLLASLGAGALLGAAERPIAGAESAAATGISQVAGQLGDLADQAKVAIASAPQEVASSDWWDERSAAGAPAAASARPSVYGCGTL